jgi:hypothetical protein
MVSPFIAIGLVALGAEVKRIFTKNRNFWMRLVIQCVIALAIFFSPAMKLVYHPLQYIICALIEGERGIDNLRSENNFNILNVNKAAEFIARNSISHDQIFLWGNLVELYAKVGKLPTTLCLTNPQFISPWTPSEWKSELLRQLEMAPPLFFISEHNDARPEISGSSEDSYASLKEWKGLNDFVVNNYTEKYTNSTFIIFQRNDVSRN